MNIGFNKTRMSEPSAKKPSINRIKFLSGIFHSNGLIVFKNYLRIAHTTKTMLHALRPLSQSASASHTVGCKACKRTPIEKVHDKTAVHHGTAEVVSRRMLVPALGCPACISRPAAVFSV